MVSMEFFSGCGVVSQEMSRHQFLVKSFDIDPMANATHKVDIMKLQYGDLGMVPDFIWASPPCFTYSLLSGMFGMDASCYDYGFKISLVLTCFPHLGSDHRNPSNGEFEISPQAHENNFYLARLFYILKWARNKHKHVIICIENPVGLLQKMPLMEQMVDELGLIKTKVDYCALGRHDKKPTFVWTNVSHMMHVCCFLFVLFFYHQC